MFKKLVSYILLGAMVAALVTPINAQESWQNWSKRKSSAALKKGREYGSKAWEVAKKNKDIIVPLAITLIGAGLIVAKNTRDANKKAVAIADAYNEVLAKHEEFLKSNTNPGFNFNQSRVTYLVANSDVQGLIKLLAKKTKAPLAGQLIPTPDIELALFLRQNLEKKRIFSSSGYQEEEIRKIIMRQRQKEKLTQEIEEEAKSKGYEQGTEEYEYFTTVKKNKHGPLLWD